MPRAIRHHENAACTDAAIRRAALAGAGNGAGWLTEIDANLLRRMDATPRLQSRLFHMRAGTGGDPARLPVEVGHLMTLAPQMQREAALSAGLTYHISAAGPALSKEGVTALATIFGRNVLTFALSHIHLSPPASALLGFEDKRVQRLIEADGWAILSLWAAEGGLAPVWLRDWQNKQEDGSISLIRSAAIAIGAAVATVLVEACKGAEQ